MFVAVVLVGCAAVFVAAGFTDFTRGDEAGSLDSGDAVTAVPGRTGGEAVFAAARWPTCLNPLLAECASENWMHWTVAEHVLPKLMELDASGDYVASPLLATAPTVANGGISADPFTITYHLVPDARWDDGSPITADDVAFTWRAYLQTSDAVSAGYELIDGVESPEPDTIVIRFTRPYAAWPDLFGGERGYVLKGAAFLNTNLSGDLRDAIPFSGGPWRLDSWSDTAAVLVPNPEYWDPDRVPRLDRVTFVPVTAATADPSRLLADGVSVAYRPRVSAFDRPDPSAGIEYRVARSPSYEALWFDQTGPLADPAVREALTLAIDRQVVLGAVVRPEFPEVPLLQCVGWVPTLGPWCSEADYAQYVFDTDQARAVLRRAGYVAGTDGMFRTPGGEPLRVRWTTDAGNKRLLAVQAYGFYMAHAAGIEIVPDNVPRDELATRVRGRDFEIGLFARTAHADPSVTNLFSCDAIPTGADDLTGDNVTGWCDRTASALMARADHTVDPVERLDLVRRIGTLLGRDHVALPMFQQPGVVLWRSGTISGPVDAWASSPYSAYWNMSAWGLVTPPGSDGGTTTSAGG